MTDDDRRALCPKCGRSFKSTKSLGGHVAHGGPCALTPQERLERGRAAVAARNRVEDGRRCIRCNGPITSRASTRYCSLPCYRSRESTASLAERFWSKVDRRGPDECWVWMSNRDFHGYGFILTGPRGGQRKTRAHVLSLKLDGRPLLRGQITLHSCDNPPCVNPAHLRGGTHSENLVEAWERGTRRRKGSAA